MRRLDKRTADILVLDESHFVRQAARFGVALSLIHIYAALSGWGGVTSSCLSHEVKKAAAIAVAARAATK